MEKIEFYLFKISLYTAFQGEIYWVIISICRSYVSIVIKLLKYLSLTYIKGTLFIKKITSVAGKHTTVIIYPCTWASVKCQVVPKESLRCQLSCPVCHTMKTRICRSHLRMEDSLESQLSLYSSSGGGGGKESVRSGWR